MAPAPGGYAAGRGRRPITNISDAARGIRRRRFLLWRTCRPDRSWNTVRGRYRVWCPGLLSIRPASGMRAGG